jgi:1-acyl-sn-glycerol-3-phosphate acyltransferase
VSTTDRTEEPAPRAHAEAPPVVGVGVVYWSIVHFLLMPLFRTLFPVRVQGRDQIPTAGGCLLAANHQSFIDIPLFAYSVWPAHVAFVARDTLAHSRILDFIMARCGTVLIRRGQADLAAIRRIAAHLEAGDRVAIFPEGTRTQDGRLGTFKKGAVLAARMAGVPIVPCAITGSYEAWPRTRRFPRPHAIRLCFAPPVDSSLPDALDRVRASIETLLGAPPA